MSWPKPQLCYLLLLFFCCRSSGVEKKMSGNTQEEPFLGDVPNRCKCIIEDTDNFRWARDNSRQFLCLTETVLEHTNAEGVSSLMHLSNVIGAKATKARPAARWGHLLEVFAYLPSGDGAARIRGKQRRKAHLKWLASDESTAKEWATAINDVLKGGQSRRQGGDTSNWGGNSTSGAFVPAHGPGRRLLVLVNPVSGRGTSRSAWEKTLRPMLEQASTDTTLVFSKRGGELSQIIRQAGRRGLATTSDEDRTAIMDTGAAAAGIGECIETVDRQAESSREADVVDVGSLDGFDGIVVVGGDGTLFEVLQGIYARPDYERQLSRLTLGVVPAGSGNGLAKTISEESGEEYGVVGAAFLAAKGFTRKMDMLRTESGDKNYLAFLYVGWGLISDVDIESEAYRWMGSLRFTVGTVVRLLGLRHYRGRISYLPAAADAAGNTTNSAASTVSFRMPPLTEAINSHCTGGSTVGSEMDTVEGTREKWVTVEGEFVLAGITQSKYISHDLPLAPASRLGDGVIDLFYVPKGAGRVGMAKIALAMEKGEHVSPKHPYSKWHRVRAFRLEPSMPRGRLTVDGELVDYLPVQQHVWPKAANVMCSSSGVTG